MARDCESDVIDKAEGERRSLPVDECFRRGFDLAPIGLAHVATDGTWIAVNQRFCEMLGYSREEVLGRRFQDLTHPEDLAEDVRYLERMLSGELRTYTMEKRYLRRSGDVLWASVSASLVPADGPNPAYFVAAIEDIGARKQIENELWESRADQELAVGAAQLGTFYCEFPLQQIIWNERCKALFFLPPDAAVNFDLFYSLLHPADRESVRQAIDLAQTNRAKYDVEYRVVGPAGQIRWVQAVGRFTYDDGGRPQRFDGIAIDVTSRKLAEQETIARARRDSVLGRIALAVRESLDPREIQSAAVCALGRALNADRCYLSVIDFQRDRSVIEGEYCAAGIEPLAGSLRMSDDDFDIEAYFPSSDPVVATDVRAGPIPGPIRDALEQMGLRSFVAVPLRDSGRLQAAMTVAMASAPRDWSRDDIELVEAVAGQVRTALETARLLSERRQRLVRESLINRISAEARASVDPIEVQRRSMQLLGEALAADRCYSVVYDLASASMTITAEWNRLGVPPIAGRHPFVAAGSWADSPGAYTSVTADAGDGSTPHHTAENMRSAGLRSRVLVRVSQADGTCGAVVVGMANAAREWTPSEVSFVESVVGQIRSALELAEVQQREHRIATQLQAALQPPAPECVADLDIAAVTRPALDEASIGGDFYDVFALNPSTYALVVGDVSGKGLAAAAQLATVRNLLRGLLYQHGSVSQAASILNRILTEHDLLNGFVTAFLCLYEAGSGRITFTSCGHEPALLRRADTGEVVQLATNDPPLGAIEYSVYSEQSAHLSRGDVLAMYTDGLSEAGPSRHQLLGVSGLSEIVAEGASSTASARETAEMLVDRVTDSAHGDIRDDICLLVARRIDGLALAPRD